MVILRDLHSVLLDSSRQFPVVTLTGPRQSGKTTLCRHAFPNLPYISLESPIERARAAGDPLGLLASLPDGAILDEIQHVPDLTSFLQVEVDRDPRPGRWILTGSENLSISSRISQSLSGRTAILHLLPPSLPELQRFPACPKGLMATLFHGAFPRIHDRSLPPHRWLDGYLNTYVQRDARQLLNIGDLRTFETFLALSAGRSAQEENLSKLASDCGISYHTVRAWTSVLESSFLAFRIPALRGNTRKQAVKGAKFHWMDSGLLCYLLGIQEEGQLRAHPQRGAVFESWVASELVKSFRNRGLRPTLFHLRRHRGVEVDLIVQNGRHLTLIECKSGETPFDPFAAPLRRLRDEFLAEGIAEAVDCVVVHGGDEPREQAGARFVPWGQVGTLFPHSGDGG